MAEQAGRRDKYESLRVKQTANPLKKDKFASLAARQQVTSMVVKQEQPTSMHETMASKRDKFSSMAQTITKTRRDKFASMAQATTKPRRDKFASIARSSQEVKESGTPTLPTGKTREERMKDLEQRIQQRRNILKDLEKAEGQVWNLILLASESAKNLSTLKVIDDNISLSSISSKYRDTLQQIHSFLSPHSKFIKAYQNHREEKEAKNMYAARLETRLSQERRNVIEEFLTLEKQDKIKEMGNNERKCKK